MIHLVKRQADRAFTLIELLIVATIMIMVAGIIYTFYINLSRTYYKGSDTIIRVLDAQNTLEVISKDLRSVRNIIRLKSDYIEFHRFYFESDPNKRDPVSDLNKLMVEKVEIRVRKDDSDYYIFERKVGTEKWRKLPSQIRSKYLAPNVFSAWRLEKSFYEVYDSKRSKPDKIPLIRISIKIDSPKNPIHLFKKVFLPIPYGKLPLIKVPESIQN
ncbi:MAG: type II secretion system protein [bacterium]|nr:type II secretion system protein [bacterium]